MSEPMFMTNRLVSLAAVLVIAGAAAYCQAAQAAQDNAAQDNRAQPPRDDSPTESSTCAYTKFTNGITHPKACCTPKAT